MFKLVVIAALLAVAVANPAPAPKPQVWVASAGVPLATAGDVVVSGASWPWAGVVSPGLVNSGVVLV